MKFLYHILFCVTFGFVFSAQGMKIATSDQDRPCRLKIPQNNRIVTLSDLAAHGVIPSDDRYEGKTLYQYLSILIDNNEDDTLERLLTVFHKSCRSFGVRAANDLILYLSSLSDKKLNTIFFRTNSPILRSAVQSVLAHRQDDGCAHERAIRIVA